MNLNHVHRNTPPFRHYAANTPTKNAGEPMTDEQIAGCLYDAYCGNVGGKAFNGDPLPKWEAFRTDPAKKVQSDAWVHVATMAIVLCTPKVLAVILILAACSFGCSTPEQKQRAADQKQLEQFSATWTNRLY